MPYSGFPDPRYGLFPAAAAFFFFQRARRPPFSPEPHQDLPCLGSSWGGSSAFLSESVSVAWTAERMCRRNGQLWKALGLIARQFLNAAAAPSNWPSRRSSARGSSLRVFALALYSARSSAVRPAQRNPPKPIDDDSFDGLEPHLFFRSIARAGSVVAEHPCAPRSAGNSRTLFAKRARSNICIAA